MSLDAADTSVRATLSQEPVRKNALEPLPRGIWDCFGRRLRRGQVWRPILRGLTQESWELCVGVGGSLCWGCILGLGFANAKFGGLR